MTRVAAAGLGLALLASCTLLPGQHKKDAAPAANANAPATSSVQRATIRLLHAAIPSRNAEATLGLAGVNGAVQTWMTVDQVSLSYDRGVLVATRGLGFDLMGAGAQGTLDALAGHHSGVYQRQMRYLDGENHSTYITARCHMKRTGREMADGRQLIRHDAACRGNGFDFTNSFWTDSAGRVLQSLQWAGPKIGYIEAWQ